MNELPSGWALATTDALFTFVTSGSRGWARYYSEEGAPFIRVGNLRRASITPDLTDLQRVTPPAGAEGTRTQVLPDDILISITADLGRVALMTDVKEATYINQHVALARPVKEINARYVAWYLSSDMAQQQWGKHQRGVTKLGLGLDDIRSVEIPIAPLAEQERIVAAVEEQFTRLDAGVAALEQVKQKLKRMRDAIRFAATLGRLVPQDPDDEPAANLIARVNPTGRFRGSKPLPSNLGSLPSGWSWALMGSLAQRVTVGHVGPMKDEYIDAGIPFLRSQNVREDRFDPSGLRFISPSFHDSLSKSRLKPGDLVIVRSGNVGTACVIPDSLGEANCADLVIVQKPVALDPNYAALYMNSLARSRVRAGRVGVALTHFNTQSVAELPVPVPPMGEQRRIVAKAQRLISVVDSLEADLIEGMRKASALRSSVLASAFSGRLVDQNPTEEPASVLLERITAGRASFNGHMPKPGRKPRVLQEEVTA
jgi:type I restriction enzyme, S subunit